MQIDRRITNGLAWAGAALIVAVPAADLIARQFADPPAPQVAIVQEEQTPPPAAALPTPAAEPPATPAPAPSQAAPVADPVTTAETTTPSRTAGGDALDSYLQSGRELPSYISNGGSATPTPPTSPAPAAPAPAATTPAAPPAAVQPAPATTPATQPARPVITPPTRVTGFPTPVSERPPSAPVRTAAPPPLVIDNPGPVVTAEDLDAWDTGPLSEFLANRQGQRSNPPSSNSGSGGFWLDEGPRGGNDRGFPQAYDDEYYYPFGQ